MLCRTGIENLDGDRGGSSKDGAEHCHVFCCLSVYLGFRAGEVNFDLSLPLAPNPCTHFDDSIGCGFQADVSKPFAMEHEFDNSPNLGRPARAPNVCTNDHITALPAELLEWIVKYLPPKSLLSLRATSRSLCSTLMSTFLRTSFEERCHLLTDKESMMALSHISQH